MYKIKTDTGHIVLRTAEAVVEMLELVKDEVEEFVVEHDGEVSDLTYLLD
jgi:hypothetical protein